MLYAREVVSDGSGWMGGWSGLEMGVCSFIVSSELEIISH